MFDWLDYMKLAKELATKGDAASFRSAISRAYYAAFNIAKIYLANQHPEIVLGTDGSVHKRVWAALESGKDTREKVAAHNGKRLLQRRTQADYDISGLSFPNHARESLGFATNVIDLLTPKPPESQT